MENVVHLHIVPPGTVVGAGRWPEPMHAGLPPWKGVALGLNDPVAWEGTVLGQKPTQHEVDAHVKWCTQQGFLRDEQAVLWDFGDHTKIYWERIAPTGQRFSIKPYEQDLALWRMHQELDRFRSQKVA